MSLGESGGGQVGQVGAGRPGGRGVVVSWVDARGPAAGQVAVGDLLEGFVEDGVVTPMTSSLLAVRMDRLSKDDTVTVRVRRFADSGRSSDVRLTAGPLPPPPPSSLGLTLRAVNRVGAVVLSVTPGSVAERAGLRPLADTITLAGAHVAPTPAQVASAFAAASADRPLLTAVTRGAEHRVLALEPTVRLASRFFCATRRRWTRSTRSLARCPWVPSRPVVDWRACGGGAARLRAGAPRSCCCRLAWRLALKG